MIMCSCIADRQASKELTSLKITSMRNPKIVVKTGLDFSMPNTKDDTSLGNN